MTTLETVLANIQTAVGQLSGIKYAPTNPPEQPADFPFVVTYPVAFRGVMNAPSEDFRMLYDIRVELHVARKDLAEDVEILLDYPEIVANAIFKTLRDNAYASEGIVGGFGALGWATVPGQMGIETIGFFWVIQAVKVITGIT